MKSQQVGRQAGTIVSSVWCTITVSIPDKVIYLSLELCIHQNDRSINAAKMLESQTNKMPKKEWFHSKKRDGEKTELLVFGIQECSCNIFIALFTSKLWGGTPGRAEKTRIMVRKMPFNLWGFVS